MSEWVSHSLEHLSEQPVLQGALAAVLTFILEDPTTVGCAFLVGDGRMAFSTALIGLSIGIALGDWGLYALGRLIGPKTVSWGLVTQRRLDRAGAWFERNLVVAIFVSRFVPGLRLPTNVGAGMMQASAWRYLPVALAASLIWTTVTLGAFSKLSELLFPVLGPLKWPLIVAFLASLVYVQIRSMRQFDSTVAEENPDRPTASTFEFWHPVVFYAPVALYYLWLAIRYRSLTLPTAANPSIYSGGVLRESKCDILGMVPETLRGWIAPHVRFEKPGDADDALTENALARLADADLALPIVAKPDEGQRGLGVRPIYSREQLEAYLRAFPAGGTICLQKLAPYDEEAGILYYRRPSAAAGTIMSITLKEFPYVTGDGTHTLRQLVLDNPRARLLKTMFFKRHAAELSRVIPAGKRYPLVFAGNHKQGAVFRDGMRVLTPALAARIEEIARGLPDFYFGRFDVRFKDLESLQRGEDFLIVEINGAAAEATHIWDPSATLSEAYAVLFEQFRVLFSIGAENRRRGHRPLGVLRFAKDFFVYHHTARKYPMAH